MTRQHARWASVSCAAALAVMGCGETRVGLLEPIGSDHDARVVLHASAAAAADAQGASGLRSAACNRWSVEREPEPALVMSVLDVSGTMSLSIQGSQSSKWDIERAVFVQAVAGAPARMGAGVLYFPNMPTSPSTSTRPAAACVNLGAMVPMAMLGAQDSPQRAAMTQSLRSTEPNLQGGAPTLDAYLAGLDELGRTTIDGSRQILLITDGQPTFSEGCIGNGSVDSPVDPAPLIDAIASARRAGVRTFVVGSPGSDYTNSRGDDARPWLSRAAEAGGTATPSCSSSGPNYCHYDMTRDSSFGRALQSALDDIGRRVTRCDVRLPDPPQNEPLDLDHVNVLFTSTDGTSTVIPRDDSPSCSNGWHYTDDRQGLVLCTAACGSVNAALGTKVELVFGCETTR